MLRRTYSICDNSRNITGRRAAPMPELPEVETVCAGLAKALTGREILGLEARRSGLRAPFPKDLATRIIGHKVVMVRRRAKYIIMELDGGEALIMHLGMSGRLVIGDADAANAKHDHLIFRFAGKKPDALRFNDPRRFGLCCLAPPEGAEHHEALRDLGPEPLGDGFTPKALREKLQGRRTPIKLALLDQTVVAGIGNIYACEALFYAGISPLRAAEDCDAEMLKRLVPAIRKVLQSSIKAGGSSLRDYVQADGKSGSFQKSFAVYDREGEECKNCDCNVGKTGGVKRVTQGGRSTFYCPRKQK